MITVFTAVYNRTRTLGKLYKSLKNQSCSDFEWLVIDDGSKDGVDEVVRNWQKEKNDFKIRFFRQEHGGKHRALNLGFKKAKGSFFFSVDSDDWLLEDAIKLVKEWTEAVRGDEDIAGVSGLRIYNNGEVVGAKPKFRGEYIDVSNFEREKYGLLGDKAEVYKTELLKKHAFPEFEGEFFVTEDVCFQEIASDGYKLRWFKEPIYVCEYLEGGLTKTGANSTKGHVENFLGFCYWIRRAIAVKPFYNLHSSIREFSDACCVKNLNQRERAKYICISRVRYIALSYIVAPVSFIWHGILKVIYKIRGGILG